MIRVEQWAEIRRLHFVKRLSIKEIHRRTGLHRQTIRRALRSEGPPRYERPPRPSKLDPFKEEVHRLLRAWHSSGSSGRRRPRSRARSPRRSRSRRSRASASGSSGQSLGCSRSPSCSRRCGHGPDRPAGD